MEGKFFAASEEIPIRLLVGQSIIIEHSIGIAANQIQPFLHQKLVSMNV